MATVSEIIKEENDYCNLTRWHEAGYTGKGMVILDEESDGTHGGQVKKRILDAAPDVTVIHVAFPPARNGEKPKLTVLSNWWVKEQIKFDVEEFIKDYNVVAINRSMKGQFLPTTSDEVPFWNKIMNDYGVVLFNAAGNEGYNDMKRTIEDVAIRVCACDIYQGNIRIARYSSRNKDNDFCTFTGALSGTSFASPYLAGIVACIYSKVGKVGQNKIYQYFKDHCKDISDEGFDVDSGWGLPILGNPDEKYFEEIKLTKFDDVSKGVWYENAVKHSIDNNYMAGISENKFAPNENLTRGQLAQVLYNIDMNKK